MNMKIDIFTNLNTNNYKFKMESVKIILEKKWSHPTCWKISHKFIKNYGKHSKEGVESSCMINMKQEIKETQNIDFHYKTSKCNEILEKFPNIPFELKCLYKVIGNPSIEYYFGEWTLNSLKQVECRFNEMKEENNNRIVDFAFKYCGMGHCVVCSYDTKDGKIFYRRDGGSNGWDREYNWKFISKYVPEENKKHNFMTWIHDIKNPTKNAEEPWKYLQDSKIVNK